MKTTRIDPIPTSIATDVLLKSLGIDRPQDIDIDAIAYYAGLRIKRRVLKECEAMITGIGDRGVISVNQDSMTVRQRFSIAHELGHWHHHRGRCMMCRSSDIGTFSKSNEAERAADKYAADLLMPWSLFKPVCKEVTKLDLKSIREVAGVFSCSLTATLIRMLDTNRYCSTMMVCHGRSGKKWHKAADTIPGYWYPKNDLDAESFAFELLNNASVDDQRFPRKIGADAWFDNWQAEKFEITEQSFRVPGDGIVTILILPTTML
jgi:Zn-dependent peptidase ImmA (M78 family)